MGKLIALIDGSIYSHSVCDNAAWIAERTGAEIELLHVLPRQDNTSGRTNLSGNITLGARTSLLNELTELDAQRAQVAQKIGRAILDDAEARIAGTSDATVRARLRIGKFVETVAEQEADADMVVVGKRGEFADFNKLNLGSHLERIARSSTKPVFVAAREFRPIRRFLVAFDGGTSAMKAVRYVADSRLFSGLECEVLMIGEDRPGPRKQLDDTRAVLEAGGIEVSSHIRSGQPDEVISTAVSQDAIDLLVMGAYSHSRIRTMIIGSTTSEMMRRCQIPMVLFR